MSVMGTGVAAGVAQTALNAQQLARQQSARAREEARPAQRVRDTYQSQPKVIEEDDDAGENGPRLRVDGQMQEQGRQQQDDPRKRKPPQTSAEGKTETDPPRPRLDITA